MMVISADIETLSSRTASPGQCSRYISVLFYVVTRVDRCRLIGIWSIVAVWDALDAFWV